jgi:hypothetical protein
MKKWVPPSWLLRVTVRPAVNRLSNWLNNICSSLTCFSNPRLQSLPGASNSLSDYHSDCIWVFCSVCDSLSAASSQNLWVGVAQEKEIYLRDGVRRHIHFVNQYLHVPRCS